MSGIDVLAVLDELIADMGDTPGTTGDQVALVRAAVAALIEADAEAIDTLDNLIHAMALPVPDAIHMKALRSELPSLLEAKRAALSRCRGGAA